VELYESSLDALQVDFEQNCLVTAPSPLPPLRVSEETSATGC
jgi:hypothetical protein